MSAPPAPRAAEAGEVIEPAGGVAGDSGADRRPAAEGGAPGAGPVEISDSPAGPGAAVTPSRADPLRVDYLVGGLRIRLDAGSHTPGPRNHINQFLSALDATGGSHRLFLASAQPMLGRIAALPEGAAGAPEGAGRPGGRARRRGRLLAGDGLRIAAACWSAARVRAWSAGSTAPVVYERSAVLQSLGAAHRGRPAAVWVVESNGIFSRETADDRQALASTGLAAAVERRTYRAADLVVAVSDSLKREICDFAAVPADKVLVLPNAIPDAVLRAVPRRPAGPPILGFAGSLVPWQRLDRLVAACAPALRSGRLQLEIIGDGPEAAPTAALAQRLGVDGSVAFVGRIPHDRVLDRMATWTFGYAGHVATSSVAMYHSPLKLWEYAGLGLDVLASPSDDAVVLRRDGLRIVDLGSPPDPSAPPAAPNTDDRVSRHPADGTGIDVDSEGAERATPADFAAVEALLGLPARTPAELAQLRGSLAGRHSWAARIGTLQTRLAPLIEQHQAVSRRHRAS